MSLDTLEAGLMFINKIGVSFDERTAKMKKDGKKTAI
jgi:hypothetical protein